jgi:hypothetical protein
MDTLAWDAKKKHGKSLRSGGCACGCRANAEVVPTPKFSVGSALAPRPGTRMRTLPEPEGRLASR